MIRTLLIEPNQSRADKIHYALSNCEDIEFIGSTCELPSAVGYTHNCDVLLVSAELAMDELRDLMSKCKVIVTNVKASASRIAAYLEAGAVGYFPDQAQVEELANAIRAAYQGKLNVPPKVGLLLVERMQQLVALSKQKRLETNVAPQSNTQLTEREWAILTLIGQGLTNHQIAKSLTIEQGTVKNHVHSILKKLNISSRAQAARYYALTVESSPREY